MGVVEPEPVHHREQRQRDHDRREQADEDQEERTGLQSPAGMARIGEAGQQRDQHGEQCRAERDEKLFHSPWKKSPQRLQSSA